MRKPRILTASVALLATTVLAGCSNWSNTNFHGNPQTARWNLAAATTAMPQNPTNFTAALAGEYTALAASLDRAGDVVDADYFARKGLAAGKGAAVPPEDNANWAIPLEQPYGFRTKLAQARTRLMAALDGGARDRAPALAARAQARYDCWNERMEDNWATAQNGPCAADFLAAMDQLEGKAAAATAPAANTVNVFFEFDRARLTLEGRQIVSQLAKQMKAGGLSASLVGKADLTGSDGYDLALGRRRADAVADELERDGVPRDRVAVDSQGKRQPPVKTADGVREPRNRVVEITLK
ncbi:MAG TPA: OmpA family protein [Stellaceae bacterium]|jgi:OOP family OmpA-OmpF porin|nr:OmpA family protein [Stellaceae bacterium]